MKTRLPKALLAIIATGMITGHAYATVDKTTKLDRPDEIKTVESGQTADIKNAYIAQIGKVTSEDHKQHKALIFLKDGEGTGTITGTTDAETGQQETMTTDVRLFVREGTVQVNNIYIKQQCNSDFDFVSVAGKAAKLELNNASIHMTDASYSGYMKSASIGNRDGEGSLILKNSSTFKTGQHLYVGYTACGNAAHGTYAATEGDTKYFTSDDAKTGHISVVGGSKLLAGDGFTLTNANIEVTGAGSEIIGSSRNIDTADWGSACKSRIGSSNDYETKISVKDRGALKAYNSLWIGENPDSTNPISSTTNIEVKDKDSLFAAYRDVNIAGNGGAKVNITATDGAAVHMTNASIGGGSDSAVNISIGKGSSYSGAALEMKNGATFTNAGTVTMSDGSIITEWRDDTNPGYENSLVAAAGTATVDALIELTDDASIANSGSITVEGVLRMSGSAKLDFIITDLTDLPSLTVESLTLTDGAAMGLIFSNIDLANDAMASFFGVQTLSEESVAVDFTDLIKITGAGALQDAIENEISLTLSYYDSDGEVQVLHTDETTGEQATVGIAQVASIPEPTTAALSLLALAALAARRRRR